MDTAILEKAGLTKSQAKGYISLINEGPLTASLLGDLTGESRTNAYAIGDRLIELGLATKVERGKITAYKATNPTQLRKLLIDQQAKLKQTNDELSGLIPSLLNQFQLQNDQPGILMLSGSEGLKVLYDDIVHTALPLSIFPSKHSHDVDEFRDEVEANNIRVFKAGITTRTLYNDLVEPHVTLDQLKERKSRGVDIRYAHLNNEAQIMIYGDNVGIRTFQSGTLIALITHPDIATSLQSIFDLAWSNAKPSLLEKA